MRLSIIVPTRNETEFIDALLTDLAPLRTAGHQVIVADGGSQDTTVKQAEPLVDQILRVPPGRASQMNAGAAVADGDVLWFLHADSRVPTGADEALILSMANGHRWGRFDVRLSGSAWPFRIIERLMNLRSCLSGIATGDQGIFVERALFQAVGGFPKIALMEDIALSRLLRRQRKPACLHGPRLQTSSRRWETHGILSTIWLMWRLRLAYALGASPDDLAKRYP